MKMTLVTSLSVLLLCLLVTLSHSSEQKHKQSLRKCPLANCVDPQLDPKTGCYTCEKSLCKFRGCVKFGAYGPSWMPDNCTVCYCDGEGEGRRREACTKLDCPVKDCFGFPLVHKPNHCCPECDFGDIPKTECGAVPLKRKSLYAALGDQSCQRDVIMYGCDKEFITNDEGEWFGCEPVKINVTVSFPDCHHDGGHEIGHVIYEDVLKCTKRKLQKYEIPLDYDPSPSWECPLYVDPQ